MPPAKTKTIMVVAGEPSGDMHAAKVIEALRAKDRRLRIFGMGGPLMRRAGMEVREDLTRQALIGFWEVLKHYPLIRGRFRQCLRWIQDERPDLLLLVDYPGFNLRLAAKAKAFGVPVCQYVAPQVWAWHESRLEAMKRDLAKLFVILPFEKDYFREKGMEAVYVGHPLLEEMDFKPVNRAAVLRKNGIPPSLFPLLCVMPGSRRGEVERIWPLYLGALRRLRGTYPDLGVLVPKPSGLDHGDYPGLSPEDPVYFVEGPAYGLRKACDLAWVKSGTGTLETALLGTPQIVAYKAAALTGFLAKRLLKVKNVSLVNLLAGRTVVPELLQEGAREEALLRETGRLLEGKSARAVQLREYGRIRKMIAKPPKASRNVAKEILRMLDGG